MDLPSEPGLNNQEMVEAIHEGKLKALYIKGEDMGIVDTNINHVQAAFEKLDLFIVQDIFSRKHANMRMLYYQPVLVWRKKERLPIPKEEFNGYIE